MPSGAASISHVVMLCFDFDKMRDFYTGVLGFHLSDTGIARGQPICFLTLDPAKDHHQLALAGGRTGTRENSGALNHVAFRVRSLAELRARHRQLQDAGVGGIDPITHGSWLSVYYRDPENNRMEFFWDTPYYVQQPIVEKLDLSLTDEEILQATVEKFGKTPGFRLMDEWKADTVELLDA